MLLAYVTCFWEKLISVLIFCLSVSTRSELKAFLFDTISPASNVPALGLSSISAVSVSWRPWRLSCPCALVFAATWWLESWDYERDRDKMLVTRKISASKVHKELFLILFHLRRHKCYMLKGFKKHLKLSGAYFRCLSVRGWFISGRFPSGSSSSPPLYLGVDSRKDPNKERRTAHRDTITREPP